MTTAKTTKMIMAGKRGKESTPTPTAKEIPRGVNVKGMIVNVIIITVLHVMSYIFPSLFTVINSVVRVKMFHSSEITCR